MSFVAKIEARAYSRATEIPDRVADAILNLYPEEFHELVEFVSAEVEGHSGDKIVIIEAVLKDKIGCETTLDYVFGKFEDRDRKRLGNTLSQRLERNCQFFVRIDKQAAYMGDIVLAKGPDVISVRIHIRQYPKCRQEDALKMLEDHLRTTSGDE
jgi:RNA binding exosome subunit